MTGLMHPSRSELEAGLSHIRQSPPDLGVLQMIVRRPRIEEREVLQEGTLDTEDGLVGDYWGTRPGLRGAARNAHLERQLTIMNVRAVALVALTKDRWPLAGDQLYLDLDLSTVNLPPGSRLAVGAAVLEITAPPHLGCKKFMARFGLEAMHFVNSPVGKELHLRGVNARIIHGGIIRVGDLVQKL